MSIKSISIFFIISLNLFSCSKVHAVYDDTIKKRADKFVYKDLRFVCQYTTKNDISKYSHVYIDTLDVKNEQISGGNSFSEYTIDSQSFKYISGHFGRYNNLQEFDNCGNEYDKSNFGMCLRFPELSDSSTFPNNITIRLNVEIPIQMISIIEPIFWVPNLNNHPELTSITITQEYYLWDGWNHNNPDDSFAIKFKDNWANDHYIIQNEYDHIERFYSDNPINEMWCSNDSFLN